MRFLKNKLLRAQEASKRLSFEPESNLKGLCLQDNPSPASEHSTEASPIHNIQTTETVQNKPKRSKNPIKKRINSPMKNIAINYGKAIASFAISHLATPYLKDHLEKEGINMAQFIAFVKERKTLIRGITGLRALLLIEEADNEKMVAYKRVFQAMGEVFIKYFSVNWIMNGRLADKMTYMKFRGNMLRRVQNPESFTYIKERSSLKGYNQ